MKDNAIFVSRSAARSWAIDNPVGDPFGGPAYGERCDLGSAIGGAVSIVGGILGKNEQEDAAAEAAGAQTDAAQMGIAEQRRQFDAIRELLKPYSDAGIGSLAAQQKLIGLSGPAQQKAAINALSQSPEMAAYLQQGENALLQNASATGGLRGGNTQAALAQFRPQLLAQLINQQYSRLGGITTLGQNSAANLVQPSQNSANAITALLQQQGAAKAGQALASGQAGSNMISGIAGGLGQIAGSVF